MEYAPRREYKKTPVTIPGQKTEIKHYNPHDMDEEEEKTHKEKKTKQKYFYEKGFANQEKWAYGNEVAEKSSENLKSGDKTGTEMESLAEKTSKKDIKQNDPGTTFGTINPLKLAFVDIVPYSGTGPGGWRAVSVIVTFGYTSLGGIFTGSYIRTQAISMEIGVPIKNMYGIVSLFHAQECAVQAMDMASKLIGESGTLGTPAAVLSMRSWTQTFLSALIPGARVGAPITKILVPIYL